MSKKWHGLGIKILEKVKPLITMHKNIIRQKINIVKIKNNDFDFGNICKKLATVAIILLLLKGCQGGCDNSKSSSGNKHPDTVLASPAIVDTKASTIPIFKLFAKQEIQPQLSLAEIRQRAFLDTIAYAEGSKWDICYGGYKANYSNNRYPCPRRKLNGITSSAFGAFQILDTTWRANADNDCKHNYSKICQIKIANKLLKNGGISKLVKTGKITHAIYKSSRIWASMPTSRGKSAYGQPSHKINKLLAYYNNKVNLYTQKQGGLA